MSAPQWCTTGTWSAALVALILAAISLAITIWQGLHQPVYTCDLRVEFPDLTTYLVGFSTGAVLGLAVGTLVGREKDD